MLDTKSRNPCCRLLRVPQCSICSGSILVTIAMVAGRRLKVPSTFVGLDHHPFALPHARVGAVGVDDAAVHTVGSNSARVQQAATIVVVVVLPCVPATRCWISGASVRPAFRRGAPRAGRARGLVQFGIARLDRRGNHHDLGVCKIFARCPSKIKPPASSAGR